MKKEKNMSKFSSVAFKLLASLFLVSSLTAALPQDGEHIFPGKRFQAPTQEKELSLQKAFASKQMGLSNTSIKAGIGYTTHNGAFHNPVLVSYLGDTVELEDGSIWSVALGDWNTTLNWYTSDLIIITPHEWSTLFHPFRLTNQTTGQSVQCTLQLGPIYNGLYTHWVYDLSFNSLTLNDFSIWNIESMDSNYNFVSMTWDPNDTIIIGVNDGVLASIYPNILINVNTMTWVRANCAW